MVQTSDIDHFHNGVTDSITKLPMIDSSSTTSAPITDLYRYLGIDSGLNPATAASVSFADTECRSVLGPDASRLFFTADENGPCSSVLVATLGVRTLPLATESLSTLRRDLSFSEGGLPFFATNLPIDLVLIGQGAQLPAKTFISPDKSGTTTLNIGDYSITVHQILLDSERNNIGPRLDPAKQIGKLITDITLERSVQQGITQLIMLHQTSRTIPHNVDAYHNASILRGLTALSRRSTPVNMIIGSFL